MSKLRFGTLPESMLARMSASDREAAKRAALGPPLGDDPNAAPVPDERPEGDIQRDLADRLEAAGFVFRWARLDQRSAMTPGWPDFDILLPDGRTMYAEIKNARGKSSTTQLEMHARMLKAGHRVYVCRSVAEVLLHLRRLAGL